MHQVPRSDQIELAEAIAEGAKRRPSQAFGEYFSDTGGSCALGAAYEARMRCHGIRTKRIPFVHACTVYSIVSRTCGAGVRSGATNGCRSMPLSSI
jgi:hypothetical protein